MSNQREVSKNNQQRTLRINLSLYHERIRYFKAAVPLPILDPRLTSYPVAAEAYV